MGKFIQDILDFLDENPMLTERIGNFFEYLADHQTIFYSVLTTSLIVLLSIPKIRLIILNGLLNKKLAAIASERPRILNEGKKSRILIVGDSTAYGTGADQIEDTLAGRFAHDFPEVEVNNHAINGSLTREVLNQLEKVKENTYNLILISTGGNDTWRFTNTEKVEQDLREIILQAKKIAGNNIVLIIYNNIASGPVFPFFLRYSILRRTEVINEIFMRVAEEQGIEVAPVFFSKGESPHDFFARDGLHPSSEGYRIMYIRLWSVLYKHMYDYRLREY